MRVIARLNVGGPAIQALLLTGGLDARRFTSVLVTGTEDEREGNMAELARETGLGRDVEPLVIDGLGRSISPLRDLKAFFGLVKLMWRFRPDIVHTHTAKAGTLGRLAAFMTGVPVTVHTFHGNVFHGYFAPWAERLIAFWESILARLTTAVVALSPRQAGDLFEIGVGRERVRIIPLGLPLDRFVAQLDREAIRKELGIPTDETVVGMVARLVPIKDPTLMVDAVADLAGRRPGTSLLVVGDGPLREEVIARADSRGLQLRILPWRYDLEKIYAAVDVVALSSKNEGLPVTLIEALVARRPVAATEVGGVPDLLAGGEFGVLADPGSSASLADAIERALSISPEASAITSQIIRERYGADRLIGDIEHLYDSLVAKRRGRVARRHRRGRSQRIRR